MKIQTIFQVSFILTLFFVFILSCTYDKLEPADTTDTSGWKCSPDTVYFQYEVLPIFVSSCAIKGCHDAITKEDGYQLTDYANIIKKGIVPFKAGESLIFEEIEGDGMPEPSSGITMTQDQKDIIEKWINQGAKNLNCNPNYGTCDTTDVKFSTFVSPIVQNKCQGCHIGTAAGGNIKLDNYMAIKASVASGKFWNSINHTSGFSAMPKGSDKMPQCDLTKIKAWINKGALNN